MACFAVLALPRDGRADEPSGGATFRWDPAWSHAGAWDYGVSALGLSTLALETYFLEIQQRTQPTRWNGPILFDTAVRDVFGGLTQDVRDGAATASWVLWFLEVGYPFVVDLPRAWARYGSGVAVDLFWQDMTAIALSSAVDFTLRDTINRARPFVSDCLNQGRKDCLTGPESTRSFPSGHVTETSTATALLCTHHLTLHLDGAPWDAVTCASAIVADAAVGVLRLMTDNHYATDLLAGGLLGVAFGWGVPVVMHLHGHTARSTRVESGPAIVPFPWLAAGGAGMGAAGRF